MWRRMQMFSMWLCDKLATDLYMKLQQNGQQPTIFYCKCIRTPARSWPIIKLLVRLIFFSRLPQQRKVKVVRSVGDLEPSPWHRLLPQPSRSRQTGPRKTFHLQIRKAMPTLTPSPPASSRSTSQVNWGAAFSEINITKFSMDFPSTATFQQKKQQSGLQTFKNCHIIQKLQDDTE